MMFKFSHLIFATLGLFTGLPVWAESAIDWALNPYNNSPMPSLQQAPMPAAQIENLEEMADRAIQRARSYYSPPPVQNYWSSNPTLGVFAYSGRIAYILWINGLKIDLRECSDVKNLKLLVSRNQHRAITGQPLPNGYDQLYPEHIEELSRNASCGTIDKLRNLLK